MVNIQWMVNIQRQDVFSLYLFVIMVELTICISRCAEGPGREILKRSSLSVFLSVCHVLFLHCNSKTHYFISSKVCRYVHHMSQFPFTYYVVNGSWFCQIVGTVVISIQYLHRSHVLIFDQKLKNLLFHVFFTLYAISKKFSKYIFCRGEWQGEGCFCRKYISFHIFLSLMLFPTYLETKISWVWGWGGGGCFVRVNTAK